MRTERDQVIELLEAVKQAEAALGENLVWLTDKLDPAIRQGDAEVLVRLDQLNKAWQALTRAMHRNN